MSEKPALEQPSLPIETSETELVFELPKPIIIEHSNGKKLTISAIRLTNGTLMIRVENPSIILERTFKDPPNKSYFESVWNKTVQIEKRVFEKNFPD